jgi:UDP-N-acetylglucosamine 2-epimerase
VAATGPPEKGDRRDRASPGEFSRRIRTFARLAEWPGATTCRSSIQSTNNPTRRPVNRKVANLANVFLVTPLDYVPFVDLMRLAYLRISDSGGVPE